MKPEMKCGMMKSVVWTTVLAAATVFATDYTWTGDGDGVTWDDTANWSGGNKFVSSTSNRLIFLNPTPNAVISIPGSLSVNAIKFAAGCEAMTLTGVTGAMITNTYKSETLTDATTETGASIFVETTEPIKIDVVQVMTGGRSVGLAQGAHLEILKPIVDNAQKKGRIYFRTLGNSMNSYLKIDYDPTAADFALDPVEGGFLFSFNGGTNEISAALCASSQTMPKPIVCANLGLLKVNAGTYNRNFAIGGYGCAVRTEGAVTFNEKVEVSSRQFTLDFGGPVSFAKPLNFTFGGDESVISTILFGADATVGGISCTKKSGTYVFNLANGVKVDFTGKLDLGGINLEHRIPTTSSVHYHDTVKCSQMRDAGNGEPAAGQRGGTIHLYNPVTVGVFYLRGYNVVCEAANVLPADKEINWRYESQANCGILDLNGFDQTTTHLNAIGAFNGTDKNIVKSAKPCTLTINDTFTEASSANARIAVQGAVSIVHNGTKTQEFNSRDIATTGDITINSGAIKLSGTTGIYYVRKITIGANGQLVLAGSAATPIPADAVIYLTRGGIIDASDYSGETLEIANLVYLDGRPLANGTYTAANADWLKGAKITVNADYPAIWLDPVDGDWSETVKWSHAPADNGAALLDSEGPDYTVTISADNAAMGPLTLANAGVGTATLAVGAGISWPAWSTVTVAEGGRILVGTGGVLDYNSYGHSGNNLVLKEGGKLELTDGEATLATQSNDSPLNQQGGDIVVGGTAKLTLEGGQSMYFGSGKTVLKDAAVVETVTGHDKNGKALSDLRLYTGNTLAGVTNHIVVEDHACIHPRDNSNQNLDQVIIGYPSGPAGHLSRLDYSSDAYSYFANQIELGATWGYAEMNVSSGIVALGAYGLGVGGFYYDGRSATGANVVGVLNVSGGLIDIFASSFYGMRNRVRGLILGEGWYDKKTATSQNLFTGYVNLSGGAISNRYGAVILGAGAAKGVWTQTGGEFADVSTNNKGPMILGWLGGEGTFILSNGTVVVTSPNVTTYVGGAETNLTPWVLEAEAPSSADAATGLLSLQGGTFTTVGDVVVGQDGHGTVELGVNGVLNARSLELLAAEAGDGKPAHSSTLKFASGTSSCGRIALSGPMKSIAEANLEFDLSAWDGVSRLQFLACNGLTGAAVDWANVSFTGVDKSDFFNAGGSRYLFRQDAKGVVIGKMTGTHIFFR